MRTTVRQLYATASATGDNQANLQIVKKGVISAIQYTAALDVTTDGVIAHIECSFAPTFQGATNDPLGPIAQIKFTNNLVTSGMTGNSVNNCISGIAIPVEPGMLLYVNSSLSGTVTYRANFLIYVTTPR